ncbi:MAG TPA: hypothetical protein VMU87_08215 [Stellaceae bacterium]|nr:hypothetical protein [Stellaceae bacterium]
MSAPSRPTAERQGGTAALIEHIVAKASGYACQAGVTLVARVAPGLGTARGDRAQLEEALLLLLANALTTTPRGGRIVLAAGADRDGMLRIEFRHEAPASDAEPVGLYLARCLWPSCVAAPRRRRWSNGCGSSLAATAARSRSHACRTAARP